MPLCGSRNCGCAITSDTLQISGSGTETSPWQIDLVGVVATSNTELFEASGTWIKPVGLAFIIVELVGGGGGSGGAALTGAAQASAGGGGGGGGYARKMILASALGATEAVTIGAGGAAGAAAAGTGGTGGTTSFGSHCSATGGTGGTGGNAAATPAPTGANGGSPGTGTNGDINIQGENGHGTFLFPGRMRRAIGGASQLGNAADDNTNASGAPGAAGHLYGGGASGAFNAQNQATNQAGAVGAAGVVIVQEFLTGA